MIDTTDKRLISEMTFGSEAGKGLDEEARKAAQTEATNRVRSTLAACGCTIADDINRLGCTGVARQFSISVVQGLRIDLAGGGVGLPCFVPPTRFCLGHNTIGGLQDKQQQYHAEFVDMISRPLTPEEAAKVAATDQVRRMPRKDAEDFIAGRSAAEAEEAATRGGDDEPETDLNRYRLGEPDRWKCGEHTTTNWACRHCVAQAVVEGPLETMFLIVKPVLDVSAPTTGAAVDEALAAADRDGADSAVLFVRAAIFKRKLARD